MALTPVWAPETVTSWLDWTTLEVPVAAATAPVVVFGEGCGNEAGAGLAADAFCGRFFGVAPRFSDLRPRPVFLLCGMLACLMTIRLTVFFLCLEWLTLLNNDDDGSYDALTQQALLRFVAHSSLSSRAARAIGT